MLIEVLVLDRGDGIAQDGREVLIGSDDAALQREASDHPALIVVKLGDRARPITLQVADLRQVGGVDQEQPAGHADGGRKQHQQAKNNMAYVLSSAHLDRRKVFVKRFHDCNARFFASIAAFWNGASGLAGGFWAGRLSVTTKKPEQSIRLCGKKENTRSCFSARLSPSVIDTRRCAESFFSSGIPHSAYRW